jgi:glycosyltransferase involved in cell wall biosynthesis
VEITMSEEIQQEPRYQETYEDKLKAIQSKWVDKVKSLNEKMKSLATLESLLNEIYSERQNACDYYFSLLGILSKLSRKYKVALYMFGTENPKIPINYFSNNPSEEEKNNLYNKCNIWLAPTSLEGLHMPPAEAMLTECPVVGTNAKLNGMQDYLINNHTGLVSEDNLKDFILKTEILINDKNLRKTLGSNAREKILELGDRKTNMERMVELFKTYL